MLIGGRHFTVNIHKILGHPFLKLILYLNNPITVSILYSTVKSPLGPHHPQLKQKLYQSQQRATLCSRAAEQAEASRGEAEQSRTLAEAKAVLSRQDREQSEADRDRLSQELQRLKKEVESSIGHTV